jgi:hypothetical protein
MSHDDTTVTTQFKSNSLNAYFRRDRRAVVVNECGDEC